MLYKFLSCPQNLSEFRVFFRIQTFNNNLKMKTF